MSVLPVAEGEETQRFDAGDDEREREKEVEKREWLVR